MRRKKINKESGKWTENKNVIYNSAHDCVVEPARKKEIKMKYKFKMKYK